MVEGHSHDDNLNGWISITRLIDQNAYADRQFESSHPSKFWPAAPPAPAPKLTVRWLPAPASLQALAPPVCIPAAPVTALKLSMGVPMDINAAHHKEPLPTSVCRRCSKPGH
ncbi:hypothetical protein H0H92_004527 [Tricholoma furcatifolium]|nr:hypothetical protein H0H92_004527 [Tricholoma furcatifolium]